MADLDPNITIDISGNTASMGTDFNTTGAGLTNAHVQVMKLAWGDSNTSERVTSNRPLPVQIQGGTGALSVSVDRGDGITFTRNRSYYWATEGNPSAINGATLNSSVEYLAVAGTTYGSNLEVFAYGVEGATAIEVTGSVQLTNLQNDRGLFVQGATAGNTAEVNGEVFPGYGFGVPIAVTAGRRLSYEHDSVLIGNSTIGISGGRVLTSSTDAVKVFGSDGGNFVKTNIFNTDGTTLGFSGDYAKVWIGGADINATVNVSSTVGVTNGAPEFSPLRVQGYTAGAGHDPVIIRGENGTNGAIEIQSSNELNTNVNNTVNINDAAILNAIENPSSGVVGNLQSIRENTEDIGSLRGDLASGVIRATVSSNPPSRLVSGSLTVTNSAQQLGSNRQLRSGINVKNSPKSSGSIAIGNNTLGRGRSNGYTLEPGESVFLEVSNINQVYVISDDATGNVQSTCQFVGS